MRSKFFTACCLLSTIGFSIGCGRAPQISAPNRKLLEALQTAVSSKNPQWLEAVTTKIGEKRTQKELSDAEFRAIDAIVKKAQSGEWKQAQKDSFQLSEGQRPTSADLAMVKNRQSAREVSQN